MDLDCGCENGNHCYCERPKTADLSNSAVMPGSVPDYAYSTIAEYEEITGISVNDAFRIGWDMARVTNAQLRKL